MRPILHRAVFSLLASTLAALALAGCSKCSPRQEIVREPPPTPLEKALEADTSKVRLKFADRFGDRAFSINMDKDRGTMKGRDGELLAHYELWGRGIKVKDTQGNTVAYLAGGRKRVELKKSEITKPRYIFRRRPQGNWALRNEAGELLYIAKKRDWGFWVTNSANKRVFRARTTDNRSQVQDAEGNTLYATKDEADARGLAWLGADELTLPERGALLLHFQIRAAPELGPLP